MPFHIRKLPEVLIIAALVWAGAVTCAAQTSAGEFRDALLKQAAFTAEELSALEGGEVVVKLLPERGKREVAFCGVVRLQGDAAALLAAFKESLTQSGKRVILGGGKVSTPPAPEDLRALTLESGDVEELKRCAAGDCQLKMSPAMIERLQREVDWGAPDYRDSAARLFKLMLLDNVRDYLARGDEALVEYDDPPGAARPDVGQRAGQHSLPYVNDSAPEFAAYLQDFPRSELPGVENALHWSVVKVGLKPVIVLTHTATYTRRRDGAPQILVATKQLYATRYFDSSLSLALLTSVAAEGGSSDTYLLYANRSHADALGGLFGGLKRRLVEEAALDGLRAILQRTKLNAVARPANQSGSDLRANSEWARAAPWTDWLSRRVGYFFLALALGASLLLLWLRKRDLKTHGT
jgi:hypothetical protein